MPIPITSSRAAFNTTLNAWTLLAKPAAPFSGRTIRNKRANAVGMMVCVVQSGDPAPSAVDPTDDEMYWIAPGDTFPLGTWADDRCDVYVRADNGSVIPGVTWPVRN